MSACIGVNQIWLLGGQKSSRLTQVEDEKYNLRKQEAWAADAGEGGVVVDEGNGAKVGHVAQKQRSSLEPGSQKGNLGHGPVSLFEILQQGP
mmetsp:Transcript_102846/g.165698  ORF Transcript_102846/g.165698 Transcript_102846/m.165698 type:complete len:92 (-) Transcript_102846:1166-1441(-)